MTNVALAPTLHNVRAFKVQRPVSTLSQNQEFALPKGSGGKAFLHFFHGRFYGKGKRPFWFFSSLVANLLLEEKYSLAGVDNNSHRAYKNEVVKSFQENWKTISAGETVNVRKNSADSTFTVSVPVYVLPMGNISLQRSIIAYCGFDVASLPSGEQIPVRALAGGFSANADEVFSRGNVNEKDRQAFRECKARVRVDLISGVAVVALEMVISKEEVQFLTNEEFRLIRPMDVYGPTYEWVSNYYGQSGLTPTFSIPLRQIASSVKAASASLPVSPRVNAENLLIDEHADIYWMPSDLEDISRFEDIYATAFTNEETQVFGVVDLLSGNGSATRRKPPSPMPVYADWVNLKFAYTNQRGRLNVMALDRTYPVNATHKIRLLSKRVPSDAVQSYISTVLALGDFYQVNPTGLNYKELSNDVYKYGRTYEGAEPKDIKFIDMMDYSTAVYGPSLDKVVAFREVCRGVLGRIENSPETAYARFSVPNVMKVRGFLSVALKHWAGSAALSKEDRELRKAYETQAVDTSYTLPAVPFVAEGRGLMPHQFKCLNLSKESPPHVLYPVDAGGGKTMIYMTDILREIGQFKTPGPFMIMCPSHLVAQYVKEIVYATDGRLNAIPITSYTMRNHRMPRLKVMIENAPDNTVLIVDYNVVTLGNRPMSYGSDTIRLFPVVEFLRQFQISVVYSDETHYLKSESQRQQAVHRLIADVPKKRGASGTFTADTIKDLVKQAALFDPSSFGTMEDFINEYALETRGTKVLAWRQGTEAEVKARMRQNFVYAEAKRKEWAAILPKPVERFHRVDLSAAQMEVYNQILNSAVESILERMKEDENLRSVLNPSAEDSDGDSADDTISLDTLLKPYLSRMERFLTAPSKDPLGDSLLQGEERVSPKARKIVDLAMSHVSSGQPGKVLIFTNYKMTAEAIYEAFPDSFRDQVLLYTAAEKEKCGAEFENNPNKTVMVGVEVSMNTGLNLQFCSRLIRCETVWIPGSLEQGNARIGRPNIKSRETRPEVFYDWVISNFTIDVTKVSYLMAKTISVAKYKDAGNPAYDALEVPALFAMTLDTIRAQNDFDSTMLDYFGKYEAYKKVMFAEWDEYRDTHKDLLFDEEGKLKLTPLNRGPNPEGSALMLRVPYVPGTEVYGAEDLGLVRYDAYMRLADEEDLTEDEDGREEESDEEDTDDETTDDMSEQRKALMEERRLAKGLAVHTDRGDGEIVQVGRVFIRVMLPSGERIRVRKMAAFVITRDVTSAKDVRQSLLKMVGDVPVDAPVEVLETKLTDRMRQKLERESIREERQRLRTEKNEKREVPEYRIKPAFAENSDGEVVRVFNVIDENDEVLETFNTRRDARIWIETPYEDEGTGEEQPGMVLSFTVVNDMLGIRVDNHEENEEFPSLAQQYGFRFSPAYYAAEIKTPAHMLRLFQAWKDAGFTVAKENNGVSKSVYQRLMQKGRKALPSTVGFSTELELRNFYREEFKPNPSREVLMPYPLIQDGVLYMALPLRAHPASDKAVREVRVPGIRWLKYDASSELVCFTVSKEKALAVLKRMHSEGVKIDNLAGLKKEFNRLRIVKE